MTRTLCRNGVAQRFIRRFYIDIVIRHQESKSISLVLRYHLLHDGFTVFIIERIAHEHFSIGNDWRYIQPIPLLCFRYNFIVQEDVKRLVFFSTNFTYFVICILSISHRNKSEGHS